MARVPLDTPDWGDDLNADLDSIEALAQAAYDLANAGTGGGAAIADLDIGPPGNTLILTLSSGATFEVLLPTSAANGRDPEFRIDSGFLQWRLVGDTTWVNLTPVTALQGAAGAATEMRVSGGFIQWRVVGTVSWTNLVATSTLTGPPGSISDLPIYTSLANVQTDITNGTLVDGDILLLEV